MSRLDEIEQRLKAARNERDRGVLSNPVTHELHSNAPADLAYLLRLARAAGDVAYEAASWDLPPELARLISLLDDALEGESR